MNASDDKATEAALAAARSGVSLYDFIRALNEVNPPSEMEERCVRYARDHMAREGEIEIDDPTTTSTGECQGTHVLAWLWVYDPEHDSDVCPECNPAPALAGPE